MRYIVVATLTKSFFFFQNINLLRFFTFFDSSTYLHNKYFSGCCSRELLLQNRQYVYSAGLEFNGKIRVTKRLFGRQVFHRNNENSGIIFCREVIVGFAEKLRFQRFVKGHILIQVHGQFAYLCVRRRAASCVFYFCLWKQWKFERSLF